MRRVPSLPVGQIPLPPLLLFDLDDTIVTFEQHGPPAWREVCEAAAGRCGVSAGTLYCELQRVADSYWSDPDRHRMGRLDLDNTRRRLASQAFAKLGVDMALAIETTDAYITLSESRIGLFPGAREALVALSEQHRLALVTNGESRKQRAKIERFELAPLFERVFIEQEVGVGKPDPAVYRHILSDMRSVPEDCCMVGDNLAWDVAAPKSLGICGIWNDWRGKGLPQDSPVKPDRIVRSIAELLPWLDGAIDR
jgi:putative hydrolase of the HAD superfamily